jgi:carbonic anhydrase/acetyltransferase-like protein (isoleucine patch superfamily)
VLVEHRGHRPQIDSSAWIAPNAVISGNVVIGPRVRILYGAVLTAEGRLPLTVGQDCVIMEQAVLRAAGRWSLELGDYVLVGPHAHLSGCSVGSGSFIATGAMVFNGARLGTSCVVALGGKVHIETDLAENTFVPMGFIAIGRPATVYPPGDAPTVHEELNRIGFLRHVFGVEPTGRPRIEVMTEAMARYARALDAHRDDRILADGPWPSVSRDSS